MLFRSILFFVFFEVVLLPMYFMIGVWGGEQRQYASLKFFLYTMFGSALMLVAFIALFFKVRGALPEGVEASFSIPQLAEYGGLLGRSAQIWIFAVSIALMGGLIWFVRHTRPGRAMRRRTARCEAHRRNRACATWDPA